jgi:hypothetical protein
MLYIICIYIILYVLFLWLETKQHILIFYAFCRNREWCKVRLLSCPDMKLWSRSWRLGPGLSIPGPALHVGILARRSRLIKLCLLCVVPCARCPCAARTKLCLLCVVPCARCPRPCAARCSVLELSTLAFPMLAALTAVVTQLASRARMLQPRTRS